MTITRDQIIQGLLNWFEANKNDEWLTGDMSFTDFEKSIMSKTYEELVGEIDIHDDYTLEDWVWQWAI